jgi:hippurate hydrolase
MPHDCLDPIPVACEIVTALQTYVARQVPVMDPAILTIAQINAGSAHNIIPAEATMVGTLRTLSEETRAKMQQAFVSIVENIDAAHGATGEATVEQGYPVTVNDARACDLMKACAEQLGGEGAWQQMPAPMMGAEDFAYVLREVPGAMAFIGVAPEGTDARTNPPLHNTRMTIEESVMARGVAMHCAMAERFLNDGMD